MRTPSWFDTRVSLGNLVTWATLLGGMIWMAAEVRADIASLKDFREKTELQMQRVSEQRAVDRDIMAEMKSDIRLIRQILEQQLRQDRRQERTP